VRLGVNDRPAAAGNGPTRPSFRRSLSGAGALIWRDRGLRILLLLGWLSALLIVYEGLAAPYTAEIGGGPIAVGLILASDPLGSVIGALVYTRWVTPARRPKMLGPLAIASAVPLLPCFLAPGLVVSFVLFAVSGAVGTAVLIQSSASFTRGVPDSSRAQALGLSQSGVATVQGLSPLLAGLLADRIGTTETVGIVGVIGLVIAIPAALAWRSALTTEPERWEAPEEHD
jgi:MFS family permease